EEALSELVGLVSLPPVPVVTWVGPAPAQAFGGAGVIALSADVRLAAPGSEIGILDPAIAGGETSATSGGIWSTAVDAADLSEFEVSDRTAAPRQVTQLLDGRTIAFRDGETTLSTLVEFEDGQTVATIVRSPG